ncbi:cold-shock protein [Nocardia takedensis]
MDTTAATMFGTVRWFNAEKGFGFIAAADGRDVFVRRTSVDGHATLSREQRVRFRVRTQREGLVAHDVQPL